MLIELDNIGKRFDRHYIFRNLNERFEINHRTALLGGNGSGKSTLLKILSGTLVPSEGELKAHYKGQPLPPLEYMRHVAFAGPYTDIIEDFTLDEALAFQAGFRPWRNDMTAKEVLEISGLGPVADRQIRNYSSGMKQRVKLILAILADTPVLLLDEPVSNLDAKAITWYNELLNQNLDNRILFVASNRHAEETACCTNEIQLDS